MPNGALDGFNHVLDFDEGLTHVFRVSAIVLLRQRFRDAASVPNLSISCCDQLLNVLVILSHSDGLLLINRFAQQPR
jgi:tetratricopeptide (TPR) repeat protein